LKLYTVTNNSPLSYGKMLEALAALEALVFVFIIVIYLACLQPLELACIILFLIAVLPFLLMSLI